MESGATLGDVEQPPEPGMVQCQAPGCLQWFHKSSNRHIYCKKPGCTFTRGMRRERDAVVPEGAALELVQRLTDPEGGPVGQEAVADRLRAVAAAQRAGDGESLYGALVDTAGAFVSWADTVRTRMQNGQALPARVPQRTTTTAGGVGLVHATLASHQRTVSLAERRVEAVWGMLSARDALQAAEAGLAQTAGTQQSVEAETLRLRAVAAYERADRALQVIEAAWAERMESVRELAGAGASVGAPVDTNGGANGQRARAASA